MKKTYFACQWPTGFAGKPYGGFIENGVQNDALQIAHSPKPHFL